jgi:hypothetical protein
LEAANLLPGAIFASELMAMSGPTGLRVQARHEWFNRTATAAFSPIMMLGAFVLR